jgi:glycosyltransferase involved in cell wall biosynthesis
MKVAICIPSYNNQAGLDAVLAQIPEERRGDVVIVDDGSATPARAPGWKLIRHATNRGYGAAQKTAYAWASLRGAEGVVLLHGDDQYPTAPTLALAQGLNAAEVVLGSRMLVEGGRSIPGWRRRGNRLLTELARLRFGHPLSELHSGARAYRMEALRAVGLERLSDDYVFDHQLLAALMRRGARLAEGPMPTRYDKGVQSISLPRALTYGLGCLSSLVWPP